MLGIKTTNWTKGHDHMRILNFQIFLASFWERSPAMSISQYTLGKVPCQEHITIYFRQGPLSRAYQNLLWACQTCSCPACQAAAWPLYSILAEGEELHQCSIGWSLWETSPMRPSGKSDYPQNFPGDIFPGNLLQHSMFYSSNSWNNIVKIMRPHWPMVVSRCTVECLWFYAFLLILYIQGSITWSLENVW